jgi:hypothetical protein
VGSHAYWIIVPLVAIFGVALRGRTGFPRPSTRRNSPRISRPERRPVEPLQPGETYDTSVKLATVPNVPLADLWCQRLREEGIEAFYKGSPYLAGAYGGLSGMNPGLPAEVWVGQHSVERARQLFPELG